MIFIRVVFPEPEGPISDTISPSCRSKETPLSAQNSSCSSG